MTPEQHGIDARQLCSSATEVVERLQEAGYEAYIVGGSVRDLLLGKAPKDFDVATDATPEEVKNVFPRARLIGRRFRLAHVRIRGSLVEVATFRGPSGHDDKHVTDEGRILRDNVWGSVEEDAVRRDFTLNALFMDPVSGDIQDYVGGYEDLVARRLKLIGDPETRYREDPVRLLRAARFVAKLGLNLDPATEAPVRAMAGTLEDIPPARLFEEVCKLFLTGHALRTMESLQRFELTRALFPVLERGEHLGQAAVVELTWQAMRNTDDRIANEQSVTPAFLVAALLWQPVRDRAEKYQANGASEYQALEQAADEVLQLQVQRTAVPRRFSSVTRQIWLNQARLRRTRGKRALSILRQPRFRAAYDFLELRAREDDSLAELVAFWSEAQKDPELQSQVQVEAPRKRRRRRGGRRRRKPSDGGGGD
nr:polynucleotide adenylyltransferase PcnB [Marinihelvus fidelis]